MVSSSASNFYGMSIFLFGCSFSSCSVSHYTGVVFGPNSSHLHHCKHSARAEKHCKGREVDRTDRTDRYRQIQTDTDRH